MTNHVMAFNKAHRAVWRFTSTDNQTIEVAHITNALTALFKDRELAIKSANFTAEDLEQFHPWIVATAWDMPSKGISVLELKAQFRRKNAKSEWPTLSAPHIVAASIVGKLPELVANPNSRLLIGVTRAKGSTIWATPHYVGGFTTPTPITGKTPVKSTKPAKSVKPLSEMPTKTT